MEKQKSKFSLNKKYYIVVGLVLCLLVPVAIVTAAYVFQPSNTLHLKNLAPVATPTPTPSPSPTSITTVLTSDHDNSGTYKEGDTVTLTATLSQPLSGVTVDFYYDGVYFVSATTNSNGVASASFVGGAVAVDTTYAFTAQAHN